MSGFYLGILGGRLGGAWLTRRAGRTVPLLCASLAITVAGFLPFWLAGTPVLAIAVRCRPATRTESPPERGLMMKAIRTHEPTGISGLVFEEAPDPKPMFCEVLVKVAACGITHNELDWPIWTCRAGHQRTSVIPGHEVSGVVTALGFGTAGIAVGDEVFGLTDQLRDGAAAEYVAVEARNVAPKPQTLDHVHAAAVPRAGLTAWQALFDHGKLTKGQTVVIHGAGGAVGSMAVQLARWAGAEVIGTGRSHSRPLVTELGADRFIALDADRLEDAAGSGSRPTWCSTRSAARCWPGRPPCSSPGERWSRSKPTRCLPAGTTSGRSSSSRNPAALS